MTVSDPFGTAELRQIVLDAWAASATRFREDANAEDLLAAGGYAGRALVELAANGVDAAAADGVPARLRMRLVDDEFRLANTGAPLTAAGVHALASLRASAKRDALGAVGFFGVGFTAVLTWTSAPRVVSTTGGVRFDEAATRSSVRDLAAPALNEELARRDGHVPALRLPWPSDPGEPPPPPGYTTEVRLPLTPPVRDEVRGLLADRDTFEDLFWALPALDEIDLPDGVMRRRTEPDGVVAIEDGDRTSRFRVVARSGELPAHLLTRRPVEQRGRTGWFLSWVRPLDSPPAADGTMGSFTVGAPVPTDEPTTLPARLVGTLPVDDTRRRLAAGPVVDWLLDAAADVYLDLLTGTEPDERWRLLPVAGFPAGPVDAALRAAVLERAEAAPFLRTATGDPVTPGQACAVPGLDADGAAMIGQAVPGLLGPILPAAAAALRPLGLVTLGWSQVSAALGGLDRPAGFWRQVYRAAAQAHPVPRPEDLADVPVPLAGGRRAMGARGCLLPAGDGEATGIGADLARRVGEVVPGLRVVHPDAVHPFLTRLGAAPADASAVLADPAMAERVERLRRDLDDVDLDPEEVRSVAGVVLDLLAAGAEPIPMLADLVLTDEEGNPWPAAELLLPDAPLAGVLDPEVDRAVVERAWVRRHGADVLVSAGVRDGFPVVTVVDPIPDAVADRLPDLDEWLERGAIESGEAFVALADLDLVDDARWPSALALIAGDPRAREALRPSATGPSYSGWWLARHATLDGHPPGHWRLPDAADLAGLYDALPAELDGTIARWIGVSADLASAAAADPAGLLDRLADPDRSLAPARVPPLTAAVVAALAGIDVDLPDGVRTLDGGVTDAETAFVLDEPWWVQVIEPGRLVPGGADPAAVARILDLPPVSANGPGTPVPVGDPPDEAGSRWIRAAGAMGFDPAGVWLTVSATVEVGLPGGDASAVAWWCAAEHHYSDGSPESLGRIAAWASGRWADRHLAIAAAASEAIALAEFGRS